MKIIEKYIIKRIVVTSMALFLLILFIIIPTKNDYHKIKKETINNKSIYLIDKDNYVSKVLCYYDELSIKEEIYKKIDIMKKGFKNFKEVIPNDVIVNDIKVNKNNVYLDLNDKFNNIKNKTKIYEALVYSLTEINGIDNIYISVNNKMLDNMPLNKSIGINKEYDLNDFEYLNKTIIFFSKDDYYVPITKINNSKEDKIKIIIKELKSSVNVLNNLFGYLDDDIELLDYKIKDGKMELVFNKYIFSDDRVKYLLSSSIFENYAVNELVVYNSDKSISVVIKK